MTAKSGIATAKVKTAGQNGKAHSRRQDGARTRDPGSHRTPADLQRFHKALAGWFEKHGRDLPWRRTHDPYAILVSELMLQQTQVVTVLDYFARWMEKFPTAEVLAAAPVDEVLKAWEGLGYYARARNLHRAAQVIVSELGGRFPRKLDAIRSLPGVGRYTAGAVATFAMDQREPIVDANIQRVIARLFDFRQAIDSTRGREAIWSLAESLIPQQGARIHNSALMELGAIVCVPRKPRCLLCPVKKFCEAADPESLPVKRPRRTTVEVVEDCVLILRNGDVLLEQEQGPRWRGLWRLPRTVKPKGNALVGFAYSITHHRVALRVFRQSAAGTGAPHRRWFDRAALDAVAMPSPHRRALQASLATQAQSPRRKPPSYKNVIPSAAKDR